MNSTWHDYSECAPKVGGRYLVTVKEMGKTVVYVRSFKDGSFAGKDSAVLAWMPLPEPFKENTATVDDSAMYPTDEPLEAKPVGYDQWGNPIYDYFDYDGWNRTNRRMKPFELDRNGILDATPVLCELNNLAYDCGKFGEPKSVNLPFNTITDRTEVVLL